MKKTIFSIGRGLDVHNPKVCIVCRRPIRSGQTWLMASNGGYRIIRHTVCVDRGSFKKWGLLK